MKILWFSNGSLSNKNNKQSGSWLFSMSQLLVDSGEVNLTNVCVDWGRTNSNEVIKYKDSDNFTEYRLPDWKKTSSGYPENKHVECIKKLCLEGHYDVIHIWGVENYFCDLIPELQLNVKILLEIQGLHDPCADVYYGDLSITERLLCMGLREWLFPHLKSLYAWKKNMRKGGIHDMNAIIKYAYISTQSQWVRDHLHYSNAHLYKTGMSVRQAFWDADKWRYPSDGSLNFYCSAAGPSPYKSIQTAIKALAVVKERYKSAKLFIIGDFSSKNWLHQPGYQTFLYKLIEKLNLLDSIIFTGSLTASEIVKIMHKCIAMVQTSYVESYSLAVAEAQVVGIPSILTFAGAMAELAKDRESGLFFSPGDYVSCAGRMKECIVNKELALAISREEMRLAFERNNNEKVLNMQLKIYEDVINRNN